MASSSGRVDTMPKNKAILSKVPYFGMISTLSLEVWIGTSMVPFKIIIVVYYKVSDPSKSVGACILPVNLCKYCSK